MTLLIENFRLFCCIANSLEDGCLSSIGAANDKDAKTLGSPSNILCSSLMSFYILFSLEFVIRKRHLSPGCLRWWKWWKEIRCSGHCIVWSCWASHRSDVTNYLLLARSERSNFLRAAPLDDNERNHHRSLLASPFIQLYSQMEFLHNIHTSLTPPLSFSSTKACRFVASSTSNSINQTARDKLQVNFPRSFIIVQVNALRVTMFNQPALAINSSLIILCHAHEISVCTTPEHHLQPSAERRLYTA